LAGQIEVDDVALSVRIRNAQLGFGVAGCCEDGRPEFFRVGVPDSDRCKHPCLVSAARVLRVQAVPLQLPIIDDGALAIGQLHLVRA
jgi:hypothetical protein